GEVALRVLAPLEEIEHIAAAAEARPLAAGAAAQDHRFPRLPPCTLPRVEAHPDLTAGERVARVDLDRPAEHRPDPDPAARTHRLHPVLPVDQHPMPARLG